jgi:predicted membrane-bound spermidine synthase
MQTVPDIRIVAIVTAAFLVSAAGLVVEIVAGRMIAPYLGMSLYTWTSVIAVVLAGLSAGHWIGGRLADLATGRAFAVVSLALAAAGVSTAVAPDVLRWLAPVLLPRLDNPIAAIVIVTSALFLLPSLAIGIPSPVLAKRAVELAGDRAGRALGLIYAAGTAGAIAGTLLAGFVFIAYLGTRSTLLAVAAVDLVLAAAFLVAGRMARGVVTAAVAAAVALVGWLAVRPWASACTVESQYYCIRTIDISADAGEEARLMVLDHLGHGMSVRARPQRLLGSYSAIMDALVTQRFGGRTVRAFFIGGGSYTLPRAWTTRENPAEVTVAEIDPQVTAVAARDFWADTAAMTVAHEDARVALGRAGDGSFDVVVGDAFTDIAVPQHLITVEFIRTIRARLAPGGVYVMNLVDHTDRLLALAAMTRTLREVFPSVEVWADEEDFLPARRSTFILLAAAEPTGVGEIVEPDLGRRFLRAPPPAMAHLAGLDVPVLTDDYAPIDRLMGTGKVD